MKQAKRLHNSRCRISTLLFFTVLCLSASVFAQRTSPVIIDHTCTDITLIPESAIMDAKSNLHIAYTHTSHGSQLTTGMTGLIDFANAGGKLLSFPPNIFAWNLGGTGGALDLRDNAIADGYDARFYPDWVTLTRNYLGNPVLATGRGANNPDVNVVVWAWCGEVPSKYRDGNLDSEYLTPMAQLESDYPGITFVYMTGHLDHYSDATLKAGNQMIRDYCINNNKVLYDFADIESYNPDGVFYEYADDYCDYWDIPRGGTPLGNWALEWQNSHTQGIDWYDCSSAHSQPLNANLKAYAAWWLWAVLGGWDDTTPVQINNFEGEIIDSSIKLVWNIESDEVIRGFNIYRRINGEGGNTMILSGGSLASDVREYIDSDIRSGTVYQYQLSVIREDGSELLSQTISIATDFLQSILHQNYPNPFNPITTIDYEISKPSRAILKIYNIHGELIKTLVNEIKDEGIHSVVWDGRDSSNQPVSSGLYFYRLESDNFVQSRKMIMLR